MWTLPSIKFLSQNFSSYIFLMINQFPRILFFIRKFEKKKRSIQTIAFNKSNRWFIYVYLKIHLQNRKGKSKKRWRGNNFARKFYFVWRITSLEIFLFLNFLFDSISILCSDVLNFLACIERFYFSNREIIKIWWKKSFENKDHETTINHCKFLSNTFHVITLKNETQIYWW
jgi:sarcosine oxidase delta subunit